MVIHRGLWEDWDVDAWALVTVEGGVAFVRVAELEGVLVDCATGEAVDLVSLVWVDAAALEAARATVGACSSRS